MAQELVQVELVGPAASSATCQATAADQARYVGPELVQAELVEPAELAGLAARRGAGRARVPELPGPVALQVEELASHPDPVVAVAAPQDVGRVVSEPAADGFPPPRV